jgi:hypothetical protein
MHIEGECMNCMLQPLSCIKLILKEKFSEAAKSYLQYMELVTKLQQGKMQQKVEDYELGTDEIILYRNRIYVRNSHELMSTILKEMHNVPYSGHPEISENSCSSQKPILLARHAEGDY